MFTIFKNLSLQNKVFFFHNHLCPLVIIDVWTARPDEGGFGGHLQNRSEHPYVLMSRMLLMLVLAATMAEDRGTVCL